MAGFFKSLLSMFTYRKRVRLESERQQAEGYSVMFSPGERGEYIEYREGDKYLAAVLVEPDRGRRRIKLHASTLKEWDEPVKGRRLTPEEFERVVGRIREYLIRLHGAEEVIIDDSPVVPMDELFQGMGWEKAEGADGQVTYVRKSPKD
jgi:hypothetical protein